MEPAAEPPTKRQRKEPAWKAGFVDPSKWKDLKDGLVAPLVVREIDGQQVQPAANASPSGTGGGEEEGASQILSCRPIDFNCVEVTVLHKGRRYRGILERTALPPGIGVSTQATKEELAAIASAPPHGENPSNMCALCNTALDIPPVHGISDDDSGTYIKVRITSNWTARVHLQCAVWCPECKEDPFVPGYFVSGLGLSHARAHKVGKEVWGKTVTGNMPYSLHRFLALNRWLGAFRGLGIKTCNVTKGYNRYKR
ncbi:hypothetical protein Vafri_633 [Volvox africanus]|nr:hypothetical protein Vafri_633 [Volvox africanus]